MRRLARHHRMPSEQRKSYTVKAVQRCTEAPLRQGHIVVLLLTTLVRTRGEAIILAWARSAGTCFKGEPLQEGKERLHLHAGRCGYTGKGKVRLPRHQEERLLSSGAPGNALPQKVH